MMKDRKDRNRNTFYQICLVLMNGLLVIFMTSPINNLYSQIVKLKLNEIKVSGKVSNMILLGKPKKNEIGYEYFTSLNYIAVPELCNDINGYDNSVPFSIEVDSSNHYQYIYDSNLNGIISSDEKVDVVNGQLISSKLVFINKKYNDTISVDIIFTLYLNPIPNKLSIEINSYLVGSHKINGKEYQFSFRKFLGYPDIKVNDKTIRFGDPYLFNKSYYKLIRINYALNQIELEKINSNLPINGISRGFYVNDNIQTILSQDAKYSITKKYTIFHFWGSWCAPCLKEFDKLYSIFNELDQNKFNIVNIALLSNSDDHSSEILKNEIYTKSFRNSVININEISGEINSIISLLQNRVYPNFIITNLDGLILYRSDFEQKKFIDVIDQLE